jgi:hypothetical protein
MRPLLALAAALAFAAFLPAPAEAQSQSQLTIAMNAPAEVFNADTTVVSFSGITTYTGDPLQYTQLNGIPISYEVTKSPAWLSVTVSPASDVIPVGTPSGVTITAARVFVVTAILDPDFEGEDVDQIEVTVMQPASTLVSGASAKNAVPVVADVTAEEPCPEGAHADLLTLAGEAADAYNAEQAQMRDEETTDGSSDEVSVQDTAVKPLSLPWLAVGGFALVGAGVGLVLRRRLRS